jgi:Ser/Thr protein kinase RdoA (MazF antagonist)
LARLDPRVEARVHEHGEFSVTLWTFHPPVPPASLAPAEYADALGRLHAAMREADLSGWPLPHFLDRVDEAERLIDDPSNNRDIGLDDRDLLGSALRTMRAAIVGRGAPDQLLHGEPHPGNLLRTSEGLLFVDLETCCRGPVEFDIAHAAVNGTEPPLEVAAHYDGADAALVRDCWVLMLAMVTAWRCEPGDDLPNGRAMTAAWLRQLRELSG